MLPSEYVKLTGVTDHDSSGEYFMGLRCNENARLIHYVLGVGTEAGELQDAVKRCVAYNKPLDKINIKEEIGDVLWYLARLCSLTGLTLEECMERNIEKLRARYGEKFTEFAALNRDLDKERKVLETDFSERDE